MPTRPIDDDDRAFITAHGRNGLTILARYGVVEPSNISPAKIGQALLAWRSDSNADRPTETDVIRGLGCLFGYYIVRSGVGDWIVVTDSFGETLGVQHKSSGWINHPLDVISKRTKTGPVDELTSIVDVFVNPPPLTGG